MVEFATGLALKNGQDSVSVTLTGFGRPGFGVGVLVMVKVGEVVLVVLAQKPLCVTALFRIV